MNAIQDLRLLPAPGQLKKRCQALAAMDAVLCPEWDGRYFSFNASWDRETGESMASMRNGEGDGFFICFGTYGAIGKCFRVGSRTLDVSPEAVPSSMRHFLTEPAFSADGCDVLFFANATEWQVMPDGPVDTISIMKFLAGGPEFYAEWASEYFERPVDKSIVDAICRVHPSLELIHELNPLAEISELKNDFEEIFH